MTSTSPPYNLEYTDLPSKTQEDLELYKQQLEEKRNKYLDIIATLPSDHEKYTQSDRTTYNDYQEVERILGSVKLELFRREQKFEEVESSRLNEIAHDAHRKARRMQNYAWDTVEHSSAENQEGFWREINFLEILESAANLEYEIRQYHNLYK
jgi:hypothetical protein